MQELLGAQQRSPLSLLAAEVDQQLSERLQGLNGIDCDAFQCYYFGRPLGDIAAALKALPGSASAA